MLAALHSTVPDDLSLRHGRGPWSAPTTEKGVLFGMRHSRVLVARKGKTIVGTLHLPTKKPWAIDVSYFAPVKKALYLTGMAVLPTMQGRGIGRLLIAEAVKQGRAWPANALRLDAFDADAAGPANALRLDAFDADAAGPACSTPSAAFSKLAASFIARPRSFISRCSCNSQFLWHYVEANHQNRGRGSARNQIQV